MGGSDQWGNITAGIELISRREGRQVHGLVFPLIATASGAKFGKSEGGNVWLDPARTSPYQFYQFWINTDDRDVERYLQLFTFLRLDQIAGAMAEHRAEPGRRIAQRLLAREVTATVHGVEAAEQAVQASAALFGGALDLEALPDMPTKSVARTEVLERPILEALLASGLASSKADARRGIEGGGFYLNGHAIARVDATLGESDLHGPVDEPFVILRKGKKNYVRLVLSR
jgi:tyrosyl-tRNA synthetase